jgi:hypothetical protein
MIKILLPAFVLALAGCDNTELDQAISNGAKRLGQGDAKEALADHTLIGRIPHLNIDFALYYAPDGQLIGAIDGAMKGRDRGTWRVTGNGQVCLQWSEWEDNEEKCGELWRDGKELKVFEQKSGRAVSVARSELGNTQKLEVRTDLELVQSKEGLTAVMAEELRTALPGNTISGQTAKGASMHVHYAADSRLWVSIPDDVIKDHGTYRVGDDGKVCETWSYLYGARERCNTWLKGEKGYSVFDPYGKLALVGAVRAGNPEKLGAQP